MGKIHDKNLVGKCCDIANFLWKEIRLDGLDSDTQNIFGASPMQSLGPVKAVPRNTGAQRPLNNEMSK